jgi:pimeloyl-ACP methyl ester carboxylesterase
LFFSFDLPENEIIWYSDLLNEEEKDDDLESFLDMAVIATPKTFEKYKRDIIPGINIHDENFLSKHYTGNYNPDMEKKLREIVFNKPTCILTGRQDNVVGFSLAYQALDRFPRATFAILDCAGHNLQIENEPTFIQMVKDWIWRIEMEENKLKRIK